MGQATYAGQPMKCPAIVSEDVFSHVQNALTGRNGNGALSPDHQARDYLLRGLSWCRECGSKAGGRLDRHASTGWERASYYCLKRQRYGSKVPHVRARWGAEDVERAVMAWVAGLLSDPETALRAAEITLAEDTEARQDAQRVRLRAQGELDGLVNEEQFIITTARKGHISEDAMVQQLDQVKARREELEATLNAELPRASKGVTPEALTWAIKALRRWADGLPRQTYAGMLDRWTAESMLPIRELISAVCLEPDGTVTVEGVIPAPLSVELVEPSSPPSLWREGSSHCPPSYAYSVALAVAA